MHLHHHFPHLTTHLSLLRFSPLLASLSALLVYLLDTLRQGARRGSMRNKVLVLLAFFAVRVSKTMKR